jgi:hypothetical protein
MNQYVISSKKSALSLLNFPAFKCGLIDQVWGGIGILVTSHVAHPSPPTEKPLHSTDIKAYLRDNNSGPIELNLSSFPKPQYLKFRRNKTRLDPIQDNTYLLASKLCIAAMEPVHISTPSKTLLARVRTMVPPMLEKFHKG